MQPETTAQRATARETWLQVALAIAQDGMPTPRQFEIADDHAELLFDEAEPAAAWATRLNLPRSGSDQVSKDGTRRIVVYWAARDGWYWTVRAYPPVDPPAPTPTLPGLAEQVTAAILDTPAEVPA